MKLYFHIVALYAKLLAYSNRALTTLTGDWTRHDAEGPFMTSRVQLMTEKDMSKNIPDSGLWSLTLGQKPAAEG